MSCLVFSGEIGDDFLTKLIRLNPRQLILCSSGGWITNMLGAIDHLAANPTAIHATGQCMSAAVPILASGIKGGRSASPSTVFMIHKAKIRLIADTDEANTEIAQLNREQDFYWAVLGVRTRRKAAWWKKQCETGLLYFTAQEALAWGLIDAIG